PRCMNPPTDHRRFYALDGVRAFAMFLGVFLHASLPYIYVGFPWAVVDTSRSVSLTLLVFVIHAFRMPAFFLIAGFFARMLYQRTGWRSFARHRARRVLLPLMVGWFALYPIMRALWVWGAVAAVPGAVASHASAAVCLALSPQYALQRLSFIHLWFLYYLLVLYVVFLASRAAFVRWIDRTGSRRARIDEAFARVVHSAWLLPALVVPTTVILLPMRGWGVDLPEGSLVPSASHVLFYGAFFAFGWLLHRQPALLLAVSARWWKFVLVAWLANVPQTLLLYAVYALRWPETLGLRVAFFCVYALLAWAGVLALLGVFVRLFDRPWPALRYLADSSYWIYLVHLPVVVLLSIMLRPWAVPWPLKLAVVLGASSPLLLASYHLLVRSSWLGVVLNGRRHPFRGRGPEPTHGRVGAAGTRSPPASVESSAGVARGCRDSFEG
ncbi:MAG: acyltransferase family protein, partial [Polyangiaceae bacterium]|nr:acyltransferase family protein [Polyangiaceae bacterium]